MLRQELNRTSIALLAAALVAAGCGDPQPMESDDADLVVSGAPVSLLADAQAPSRPFHAEADLTWAPLEPVKEGRCSDPASDAISTFVGTLEGTHLGPSTVTAVHCSDFDTYTCSDGVLTIVSANGDELHGTYQCTSASLAPPRALWTDRIEFTGGTGRFRSARGWADEAGWVDLVTGRGASTMSGVLAYRASNRAKR